LAKFDHYWQSPAKGLERLIVDQTPTVVLRRFLDEVSLRPDYPVTQGPYSSETSDEQVGDIAFKVLKARKGDAWGYAAMVMDHCETEEEIPEFIREVLTTIDEFLTNAFEEMSVRSPVMTIAESSTAESDE
jgi:putative ATP-dependent endonuclease of OLD family